MPNEVILSIDGEIVYDSSKIRYGTTNKSSAKSVTSVPKVTYNRVPNPTIGKEYFYMDGLDEDNNTIYTKGTLLSKKSVRDGPMSFADQYIFKDRTGKELKQMAVFNISNPGGGSTRRKRRKLRKSKKRRSYLK